MARHTAKSHKIRKVEILVIQITIVLAEHMIYVRVLFKESTHDRALSVWWCLISADDGL